MKRFDKHLVLLISKDTSPSCPFVQRFCSRMSSFTGTSYILDRFGINKSSVYGAHNKNTWDYRITNMKDNSSQTIRVTCAHVTASRKNWDSEDESTTIYNITDFGRSFTVLSGLFADKFKELAPNLPLTLKRIADGNISTIDIDYERILVQDNSQRKWCSDKLFLDDAHIREKSEKITLKNLELRKTQAKELYDRQLKNAEIQLKRSLETIDAEVTSFTKALEQLKSND